MITLHSNTLSIPPLILLLGAALAAVVGSRRLAGAVALVATGAALAASVVLLQTIADAGSFRFFDSGGWAGARLTGDLAPASWRPLVPLSLDPTGAPLLLVLAAGGAAATLGLVAGGAARSTLALGLALQAAVAAFAVVDRPAHGVAAWAVAAALSTLAPGVAAPGLIEARAVVRTFVLHRVGDAGLLVAMAALSTSLGAATWEAVLAGAPAVEPWARTGAGVWAGTPHRTLWFVAAVGVAVAFATRSGLLTWPLQRDLTATSRLPPALSGLVHGVGLLGPAVVLLVRWHPVLALSPEVGDGLVGAGVLTLACAGALALAARDLLRVDALLLPAQAGVVAVLAGAGDVVGVVLGGALLVIAGVGLPWSAAVVVAATHARDPVGLGGLEPRIPRTHSTRLLLTVALTLPPAAGWVVVERALEATVLSTRIAAVVVVGLGAGAAVAAVAAWRLLYRVFDGPPVEKVPDPEPGVPGQLGGLLLAFAAPGLAVAALPRGLWQLLPWSTTYEAPLQAFCAPALAETAAVRALYAAPQAAPPVTPSAFVALAAVGAVAPWIVARLVFRRGRGGRPPPGEAVVARGPLAALGARLADVAGRDAGVVRTVRDGVEALSRLLAVNLIPAVLDLVLQRVPAFAAAAGALLVRGTQTGSAPQAVVLALAAAAWLVWWAGRAGAP
jgi:NADH:ubiquinone oxidoreductase subunit 5 (subunit L)/multisubunit Na+/H+ antiporter MnhA subunit